MTDSKPTVDIGQLVAEQHAAVYRYAFRLTGTVCDAEDLTQQTFLAAHVNLGQLHSPDNARAWLFTILRNNYTKLRGKRTPLPLAPSDLENMPDDLPAEMVIDGETLQQAINELPDEFKIVVLMFYFEDCSYRDIADRLGLPVGTVMSRLARSKARLRARLMEAEQTEAEQKERQHVAFAATNH